MHPTYNSNWIFNEEKEMVGIDLGFDYCAEHQFGIEGILRNFGIADGINLSQINDYKIKKLPPTIVFQNDMTDVIKKQHSSSIFLNYPWNSSIQVSSMITRKWDRILLKCAWDNDYFGILAHGENQKSLQILIEHFKLLDIAIIPMQKSHIQVSSGLAMVIPSRLEKGNLVYA